MYTKKIVLAIVLSFAASSLNASDIDSSSPSSSTNQPTGFNVEQPIKKLKTLQLEKDNNSTTKKQSKADKKTSMIDYCRRHTC